MMKSTDATSYYLAIDQGGHASRALLFNSQGDIASQSTHEIATFHPQNHYVEHDPTELIASIYAAINDCLSQFSSNAQNIHITAAGLATQRSSIMCWNQEQGTPLSKVISWQDRRAAAWMQQFVSSNPDIHKITGLYPSAHYGVSKIHWCLNNLPKVIQHCREETLTIGPLASYISYHLCKEHPVYTDPANGSRTLLLNINTKDWDNELLKLFNIQKSLLPRCKPSHFPYGTLYLPSHTIPLTTITGDQSAAVFHNGFPDTSVAYINLGTGAFIQRIIDTPPLHCQPLLSSIVYSDTQRTYYALEGTVNGAGSALNWFEENTVNNAIKPDWQTHFETWLQKPSDQLYFINAVSGIGSPYWLSNIPPHFIGEGSVAERFCAIVESILFLILKNIETMNSHLPPANALIVSGGLSHSDALCQRLADLTKTPVLRPKEKEATARGLCFLLNQDKASWRKSEEHLFEPQPHNVLQQRYKQWLSHMAKLTTH